MSLRLLPTTILLCVPALACTGDKDEPAEDTAPTIGVLGGGTNSLDGVDLAIVADADDGLARPMDLGFNPRSTDQLWVVSQDENGMSVIFDAGTDNHSSEFYHSMGSDHFCVAPSAIAFSDFGNFGTAQDTDDRTQGAATPADFMGPVLWDDNLDIFDSGHGSHLDMLHNSPLGGGMAWDEGNAYWYFDGYHGSITWYDFVEDHDYGGADHSDGVIRRYVEGEVARFEGIPSHMELDRTTGLLYIADTANGRIAVMDTNVGEEGSTLRPNYDGVDQKMMDGGEIWTLVDNSTLPDNITLREPAGLAIKDGILYLSDHGTGGILGFDLEGNLIDWINTERGSDALGGIDFGPDGAMYVTDVNANEILRFSAK